MMTIPISDGRISANWTPDSAIWIQSAAVRQLESYNKHEVTSQLAMLAVGRAANSPTGASCCLYSDYVLNPDVGDSSPFRGRGKSLFLSPVLKEVALGRGEGTNQSGSRYSILVLDLGTGVLGYHLLIR